MSFYICSNCGYGSVSWMGRCPECGSWNTMKQQQEQKGHKTTKKIKIVTLKEIASSTKKNRLKTGIFELDRVLGGGMTTGEVVLLSGEPGVGKSTLLLQALHNLRSLYVSGEEAGEQIKSRAERLKINEESFYFSSDSQVEGILQGAKEIVNKLDVIIIDSIQTVYSKDNEGLSGSVSQIKESTAKFISFAKENKIPIIIVGHITKEGDIAGPKTLEHLVDCVLLFEGEKTSNFRILRSPKNRFGPTDEIGIFEMKMGGLHEVSNPLAFLDNDDQKTTVGKTIVGVVEGKRPLFFEIQSLAVPTVLSIPRRVVKGVDYNKVLLLLAVIKKYLRLPLDNYDIYVNVIGGVDIKSTAADLGIITSLLSSVKNINISHKTVFIGEIGLLGEVRKVYFEEKILKEAKRLGFDKIYSSLNLKHVKDISSFS